MAKARWEWQVFGCQLRELEAELNQRETEGWETAQILNGARKGTCVAIFRRPLGERARSVDGESKTSRMRKGS
ncbi:MAG TPA: hypothetical protein PK280_15025 [Planctomycetota bacterium]|nr:hypothetical protein [Planctomycetota bacterium]